MSNNKSRLGRGLGGLIAGAGTAVPKSETSTPAAQAQQDVLRAHVAVNDL